jgi:hypothetical protein
MYYKTCLTIAVGLAVSGCAVLFPPIDPNAAVSSSGTATALTGSEPITQVDVTEFRDRVQCEPMTRTGTRIVVSKRCYPLGKDGVNEQAVADQLDQVRKDQEELDRRRREVQERRGPGLY